LKSLTSTVTTLQSHHFSLNGDQAGVGEVHRLIGVLANQLADARMVFAELPWADDEALGHGRQDRPRIAKKTSGLG